MGRVELVLPSERHLAFLLNRLRPEDREELEALAPGVRITLALLYCVDASICCRVLLADEEPIAVSGLGLKDGCYAPWLVGTEAIERHPLAFMRASRELLKLYRSFGPLRNWVGAWQERSLRYLEALGFTLGEERDLGQGRFREFYMEAI